MAQQSFDVSTGVSYDMWWNGGNRNVPVRHNIIGLLTEAASVRIASPIFLPRGGTPRRSHSSSGLWPFTRRSWARNSFMWPSASATWRCSTKPIVAVAKKKPQKAAEPTRRVRKRPESRLAADTSPKEVTYSRIDIDAVRTYKGRWVKILMRDGIEREGKILEVEDESLRIEQNFNFGSMTTSVKFHEILDLLLSDS